MANTGTQQRILATMRLSQTLRKFLACKLKLVYSNDDFNNIYDEFLL